VRAEQEFPVPSLPTPSPGDAADLPTLTANASVALFVERAPRTNPGFEVTAAKAAAVSEACVRLEGLPLALELAAARLRVLTPGELVFRLDKRLGVLAGTTRDIPVRQRALSAAIAWSHDLLSAPERALFRRLSVFHGEWTVTDAEGVCGSELADVLGLVESLLDKSLIRRVACDADTATFAMLDSLRQFAAER
jgi:predicted ATPase